MGHLRLGAGHPDVEHLDAVRPGVDRRCAPVLVHLRFGRDLGLDPGYGLDGHHGLGVGPDVACPARLQMGYYPDGHLVAVPPDAAQPDVGHPDVDHRNVAYLGRMRTGCYPDAALRCVVHRRLRPVPALLAQPARKPEFRSRLASLALASRLALLRLA